MKKLKVGGIDFDHLHMGDLLCAIEEGRETLNYARGNTRSFALCFAAIASAREDGLPVKFGEVRSLIGVN